MIPTTTNECKIMQYNCEGVENDTLWACEILNCFCEREIEFCKKESNFHLKNFKWKELTLKNTSIFKKIKKLKKKQKMTKFYWDTKKRKTSKSKYLKPNKPTPERKPKLKNTNFQAMANKRPKHRQGKKSIKTKSLRIKQQSKPTSKLWLRS